ncbi:MAG TPA: phosphatidylglycerophosphatase A [Caldimonas sp.]|nr:phosphatidylglycerophosphatase A [Caldimonas sp.]
MAAEPALHPPLAGAGRRPGWRFLVAHPAHVLALGFGSGLSPWAPGTVGTLWAWLIYVAVAPLLGEPTRGLVIAAAVPLGWWACTVTARHLDQADPAAIVWDEVIAFWLILWLVTPATFVAQAVAFVLFRIFDAAKPGPVAWADQRFKRRRGAPIGWAQGFGILFDDVVAALCTLLVIAIWRFV